MAPMTIIASHILGKPKLQIMQQTIRCFQGTAGAIVANNLTKSITSQHRGRDSLHSNEQLENICNTMKYFRCSKNMWTLGPNELKKPRSRNVGKTKWIGLGAGRGTNIERTRELANQQLINDKWLGETLGLTRGESNGTPLIHMTSSASAAEQLDLFLETETLNSDDGMMLMGKKKKKKCPPTCDDGKCPCKGGKPFVRPPPCPPPCPPGSCPPQPPCSYNCPDPCDGLEVPKCPPDCCAPYLETALIPLWCGKKTKKPKKKKGCPCPKTPFEPQCPCPPPPYDTPKCLPKVCPCPCPPECVPDPPCPPERCPTCSSIADSLEFILANKPQPFLSTTFKTHPRKINIRRKFTMNSQSTEASLIMALLGNKSTSFNRASAIK